MPNGRAQTVKSANGIEIYFETHGDPSKPAILMGPHFYMTPPDPDTQYTVEWIDRLKPDFFLINPDYPYGTGKTESLDGLAFSPDLAMDDYQRIADAAGVDRFGWVGYSYGGAMGVQIACRTNRVSALVAGGWPPINAPYQGMVNVVNSFKTSTDPEIRKRDPRQFESTLGFYTPLLTWPEREEVAKLAMPRLAFIGDEDIVFAQLGHPAPLAELLRQGENELRAWGWEIAWLKGHDHGTAIKPDVSLPVVHRFFRDALL